MLGARPRQGAVPAVVACLAFLVLLAGCDERDRTNPLDPRNDQTGGAPDWLRAVAGNGAVTLEWEEAPADGFDAFELFRRRDGEIFSRIHRTEEASAATFRDSTVANASDYTYRLDVVLTNEARVSLPQKTATPGSAVPWIVESGSFGLLLYSPDGRSARLRTGTGSGHFDIAVAADGATLWAADYFGNQLHRFDDTGALLASIPVALPFRLAVDRVREVVWAASWRVGNDPTLIAFDFDGKELGRFRLREEARDLVVDEGSGACYVALGRGEGVARAVVGDTLRESGTSETIMMLALAPGSRLYGGDPLAGGVFGYDLDSLRVVAEALDVSSPQSMTVADGSVWVVDGRERIVRLDADLGLVDALEGVGLATGVALDEETSTLWLALPEADRVVRLTTDGEVVTRIPLYQPFGVAIGRAP